MLFLSSLPVGRLLRACVAGLAAALVLVPTMARARQHVEHREATRLSIKHNWVGVVPTSKATVAPEQILIAPTTVNSHQPGQPAHAAVAAAEPARRPVIELSPEPLRGPPSIAFLL